MTRFIDPKTLARIKDLPLVAQTVANGFMTGIQRSEQKGTGIEFSQYRVYEPGDEPGRIDWKLFARSDRYFVREAERESETAVWYLLDCSGSMQFQSIAGGWNKFDYARHLVGTLSLLAHRQGDATGLLALSSENPCLLPASGGHRHWLSLLARLSQLHSGHYLPSLDALQKQLRAVHKRALVVFISDFYPHQDNIVSLLGHLKGHRTDVLALQLQSDDELQFNYRGTVRFEDLESGEVLQTNATAIRQQYLQNLADFQQQLSSQMAQLQIPLYPLNIDQPMDHGLYQVLKHRMRMR